MKIAFAAIVKPDDVEADLLDQCLSSIDVDAIYITQAGTKPNDKVSKVIKKHKGVESFYEWDKNFANARNYNFSQVPKEYDYILWLDADDTLKGDNLRTIIEQNPGVDTFSLWYNYAFDEWGNPIVVHAKTRVVRNDGCVTWAGALHEDFAANRSLTNKHIEGVEVIHNSTYERIVAAKSRNLDVAEKMVDDLPDDPRSYWNLAQSQYGAFQYENAIATFTTFIAKSQSEEEKYVARLRKAEALYHTGKKTEAIDELRYCVGTRPDYPDAYIRLGEYLYHTNRYAEAVGILKQSLRLEPPVTKMIVFNPMEYQYTPLKWLAYSYIAISQPMLAFECFKLMFELTPRDEKLKDIVDLMQKQAEQQEAMLAKYNDIKNLDKLGLLTELNMLPDDWKCHPMFVNLRNVNFPKTTSTGKEIAYYCGYTDREWDADAIKEGIGGSEEAVINLAKLWTKAGYQVTVYNNCGNKEKVMDGVTYKPFYTFNYRDKHDTLILWRSAKLTDYELNATTVLVDLHDVIQPGEFNEKRLAKIDKIFVKSQFHRSLFPNVPDDKFVIVPNGVNIDEFKRNVKRDPMLLVNTSSPDRSLSALVRLFKKVKEKVPEAKCEWAYGFGVFDSVHSNNPTIMAWKDEVLKQMEEVGIVNRGRLSHKEVAEMYKRGRIFAYPTEFAEIDCISARKAQLAGCIPITTNFAALDETVRHGVKIKSKKTKDTWCAPGQFDFGITDKDMEDKWVAAVVAELKAPMLDEYEMVNDMKQFDWKNISSTWLQYVQSK